MTEIEQEFADELQGFRAAVGSEADVEFLVETLERVRRANNHHDDQMAMSALRMLGSRFVEAMAAKARR